MVGGFRHDYNQNTQKYGYFSFIAVVERIMGSEKRKVHLGMVESSTCAVHCGMAHEVFYLRDFRLSSTNHSLRQVR